MGSNPCIPNTILVVDDEVDIQEMIETKFRKQIRKQEFRFLFAQNGEDALQRLEHHPETAIILTDLNMPGMDGLTLLKTLSRDNGHGFSGHAIVITAYGDYDRQRQAMHHGAFDFLNKPLDLSDLEITMARALKVQADLKARIARLEHEKNKLETRNAELEQELQAAYTRIDKLETVQLENSPPGRGQG